MTNDGWVLIVDAMRKMPGCKTEVESFAACLPTADLYGITTIKGREYLAFRCHMSSLESDWPQAIPFPHVIWAAHILKYMDRSEIGPNTRYFQ